MRKDALSREPDCVPLLRRDDDVYLVSYPKSGNTWVSFLIANIINTVLDLDWKINFFNLHGFVPDIHQGRHIPLDMGFFPFKRIIKSHHVFTPEYKNVIYLVRDPRSVMLSYHRHLTGLGQFDSDLHALVRDPAHGIQAWREHVRGWFEGVSPGTRFRILRFEDFRSHAERTTSQLAELLGAQLTAAQITHVVECCNIDRLRTLESSTASLALRRHEEDFRFIGEGSISRWRTALTPEDEGFISQVAGEWLSEFSYA